MNSPFTFNGLSSRCQCHNEPMTTLHLTGDAAADTLLSENPFALLVGMLLDQQIAMETAFAGPAKIRDRIGVLDPVTIAAYEADAFALVFRQSPAVHRFPGSMAKRVQEIAALLGKRLGVDAAGWREASAPYGEEGAYRSVADIVDPESLTRVRATKRAAKAAAKS